MSDALVIVNTFDKAPHVKGALVLYVLDSRWEMKVEFDGATYWVFAYRLENGKPVWTRLAGDGGTTPETARERARNWWKMIQSEQ